MSMPLALDERLGPLQLFRDLIDLHSFLEILCEYSFNREPKVSMIVFQFFNERP